MTSSISTAVFKAIVGMLVRKGRTKRGEGARYGARLVPSRISHQIFFLRLQLSCRTSTFRATSTFLHDFSFFSRLQLSCTTYFFSRIQLSCTTSPFWHDFNFFHDCNFCSQLQHFNFPAWPKYSAVLVDWSPLDLDPPVILNVPVRTKVSF